MLTRLGFPRVGRHKRFVAAIVTDTLGSGLFMPITLLYFAATTDLSLVTIGAAISISALITTPVSFFAGTWVDRFGARQMMLLGNLLQAVGMVAYLWSDTFLEVALWTVLLNVGRQFFWGAFGPVVTAITEPGERETWFGFLQALRNLGYALGGLVAGAALQIGTDSSLHTLVVLNAATFVLAFVLLLGVPDPHGGARRDAPAGGWGTVLRDRPFLRLFGSQLGFAVAMMVLNYALPVYVAETLDLPGWTVGVMFTLNTLMVGLGQGLVVRWMDGRRRFRMIVLSHLVFASSYGVFVLVGVLPTAAAVVMVLVGVAVYTLGELIGGPVINSTAAEAAPEHLRGRYLSLGQLAWGLTGATAPLAFTWLLTHGTASVWVVLAVVALLSIVPLRGLAEVMPAAGQRVRDASRDRDPVEERDVSFGSVGPVEQTGAG